MATFAQRMVGAAKLDVHTYEEVEADPNAMGQAMGVVVLSSVAAGIGEGELGLIGMIIGAVGALVGWFIWAFLVYVIGTKVLPEPQTKSDIGELMRTIGFAATPGVLRVFGFIPLLGWLLDIVVAIWMLVAMVVAVRQALDYKSTGRAIGVCVLGWLVLVVISLVVGRLVVGGL